MNRSAICWIPRPRVAGRGSPIAGCIRSVVLLLVAFAGIIMAAPVRLAAAESPKTVAAAVQQFVDNHTLAGAVMLVASSNRVLSLQAVGYMDIARKRPLRTDALFWIASQSKPMTATAVMMLVDEGKVNVDDPVEKYLPEFKGQWLKAEEDAGHMLLKRPAHPITVKNVLSHTSGLPFSSPLEQPTLDLLPIAARVRSYAMLPLEFEPDSKYSYSNEGINTAGRIIEVVSGMPYQQFMEQRLFQPLGMKDTTFWPSSKQVHRLAKSYKANAAKTGLEETTVTQLRYPLTDRTREPMPAGGLFSTASDVARFCQMILNGGTLDGRRYLSEAAVRQMTSKQTPDGIREKYGFGWSVGNGEFGHGGAYATNMTIDPSHRLVFIWMVQHASFPGDGAKSRDAFMQAAKAAFSE
ncbi:MAG TPA: serine hydrolase domain-containing protein [Terriglobia bacterium]|nr:serine hydrolase domain-containing protein [Terriglobia bacterium]